MFTTTDVPTIAHAIQLAVTPVFLVTGISAFLGVLTNRLARIIDRSRTLQAKQTGEDAELQGRVHDELVILALRARIINWALGLSTASALLVCSVIAVIFLGEVVALNVTTPVSWIFVSAMLCLILALLGFIREIFLATAHMRIKP